MLSFFLLKRLNNDTRLSRMLNGENPLCYRSLKKRKRNKDDPPVQKPTHTCLDGDTIYVHPDETTLFLKNYAEDVMENGPVKYYISELNGTAPTDIVRVWFELDLKHENPVIIEQVNANFEKTDHFVGTLCLHLIQLLRKCFPKKSMHISVIADKRFAPSETDSKKTGVHLHVPEVFVTIRDLQNLRNSFVNLLDSEMDLRRWGFNDVTWDSVIDASPIAIMKGLRLPGSRKCTICTPDCKKSNCTRCNGNLYLGIETYYLPHAWFYDPPKNSSAANNCTAFPDVKTTVYSSFSLEKANLAKIIFNVSIKTNGTVIALHEQQVESPCKFRKTATVGFELEATSVTRKKPSVTKTSSSSSSSSASSEKFLTPAFEFTAGSDFVNLAQNAIRIACCSSFSSFLSNKKISTFKQEKTANGDALCLRLRELVKKHKEQCGGTPGTDSIKVSKLYQSIEIASVKAGMIKNGKKVHHQITELLPITISGGPICKMFERMPYCLVIYFCPVKNDASKTCMFKGSMHSQNNVYFQTFFPVMTQSMRDFEDGDAIEWRPDAMAQWIAQLVNMISTDQSGFPCWPVFLRCYSKQNCEGRHFAFAMPWPQMLDILEPMISQILLTNKLKLNEKRLVV